MSERLTREIREEIEKKMADDAIGVGINKIKSGTDVTVPGEEEACESVKYHQKEWERITKGINLRDLYGTKKMLEDAVKHYNQLQRLKPYGRSFFLDEKGTLRVSEPYSVIAHSMASTYKIELSAKGLPTKNIEDLTVTEAEEYYESIKTEIEGLQELIRERGKYVSTPSAWEDELFRAYERCALALRVIGELSDDAIPQRFLDDYQRLLKAK